MSERYVRIDYDTPLLLPIDLREWVEADHLVHFLLDAVEEVDMRLARVNTRGTGSAQYPPRMLLALLLYSYATGTFSSRQIERSTYDSVPVRFLCSDTHPDHDTLCTFRRSNAALLQSAFGQVLEMAARCGVLRVGGITVAIDGTKVLANASKHAAVSYEHATQVMRELDLEMEQLLAKAENVDSAPLEDGLSIPDEIRRRAERRAKLAQAKAEIERRALARTAAEQAEYEAREARREAQRQAGKKPRGRPPVPPTPGPGPQDQMNFTDPQSRMMKVNGSQHFEQCYNAQAAVDVDSRLIVGQRVTAAPNDKEQLVPTLAAVHPAAGPIAHVLIDSGFTSEKAIRAVEATPPGQHIGSPGSAPITVLAPTGRERHHRTVTSLEKRADPPAPLPEAPFAEHLAHRVATTAGRALYKLRQQTVEPIFGIIKQTMRFRAFSMRGLDKVSLEWTLVSTAYNLKRLFHVATAAA